MKIFLNILTAIGIILAVSLTGIYFLPDHYSITQSIEIKQPTDVVYAQVCDFRQWQAWNPWSATDTAARYRYEGMPGTIGHTISWLGNEVGQGNITITTAVTNTLLESELHFIKPFSSTGKDKWEFENLGDKTRVTWTLQGPLSYPLGRLFGLSIGDHLVRHEQQGLDRLRQTCETASPTEQPVATVNGTDDPPMP